MGIVRLCKCKYVQVRGALLTCNPHKINVVQVLFINFATNCSVPYVGMKMVLHTL